VYPLFFKRWVDFVLALTGLVFLAPLIGIIAVLIKSSSDGPILYSQKRVGRYFKEFDFYKFRSMVNNADKVGPGVTAGKDSRITPIGAWLRRTKLDELPQLFNVLKGDIALVGPRPELLRYVSCFQSEYTQILTVRPGITDYAAIAFRDEEILLNRYSDVEAAYIKIVLPQKIELYLNYIQNISLWTDLKIVKQTIVTIFSH
jgi:lipopolysaccharide/colanic/teichoic acid biosynthesis glycosyltransferase